MEGEGVPATSRRRERVVLALVAMGAVLIALVAAGSRVPVATERGQDASPAVVTAPPGQVNVVEPSPPTTGRPTIPGANVVGVVLQATIIVAVMAMLVLGARVVFTRWPSREVGYVPPIRGEPPMRPRPEAIVDAVDQGLDDLVNGPVDDVVIACWVRLEQAAAAAGVERLASETPSELASRVLRDLDVPAPAIEQLLARYRTARYSDHPLGGHDRAVAITSLEEIRAAIVGSRR